VKFLHTFEKTSEIEMVTSRGRRRQADCLEVRPEGRRHFRFGANSAHRALVELTADVLRDVRTPPDRFSYVSGNLN
jgi:hypothetical protein